LKGTWNYLKWDGKDDKGNRALYGKYHFRLTLTDMSGNVGTYEYTDKIVTIGDIYGTVAQTANLRSGPGTNYSILTTMSAGKWIIITDESGNWYKTTDSTTGLTGYISKNLVATRTHPISPVPANPSTKYQFTLQKGVTLDQLASNYGVTVNDIMNENHLTSASNLTVGQVLTVTVYDYYSLPAYYVVQSGDTLWSIAQKNHVTMDSIVKLNKLTNPGSLYVGQRLQISQ
jgi:LysM repeat protein